MGKLLDRRTAADPSDPTAGGWSVADALDTYGVRNWGKGYFGINPKGHVTVHPDKDPARSIDLKELVDQLTSRGIQLPILLRFSDVLRHRIGEIADAFKTARTEFGYQGDYCCVYPIKVNQQRHVVEEVLACGRPHGFGLEAGSKPELMAVLAVTDGDTQTDRKSTRLNSSHSTLSRMPSSA